jgi:osmotically-inducible protein OsmY
MLAAQSGQGFEGAKREDRSAASIVQEALQRSGYRGLRGVTAQLSDGVLVLRGCVDSFYQKQIAQTIARRCLGSGLVIHNRIRVVHQTKHSTN